MYAYSLPVELLTDKFSSKNHTIYMYMYMYMYICVYMCVYVCIYVYMFFLEC